MALYGRTSTTKQDADLQRDTLRGWAKAGKHSIVKEYYEIWTGADPKRPKLKELLEGAGRGQYELVAVTKLDRLSRSLRDLLNTLATLERYKVGFVCIEQNIDTSTPVGKLLLHVLGALAEFERSLIMERTRAGIAKAQAAGKMCHRPPKEVDEGKLRKLLLDNYSLTDIAGVLGVSRATVTRRAHALNLETPKRSGNVGWLGP